MSLCKRLNTVSIDITRNLHYQIIRKIGHGATAGDVHRPHFLSVVEDRIHHIDCKLQLMDAAS